MAKLTAKAKRGIDLEPLQHAFLEELATDPGMIESALKERSVSPSRLARWLGETGFRAAYFQMCSAYEEMFLPAVVSHLRKMAMSGEAGSHQWAKLYLEVMEKRATTVLSEPLEPTFEATPFGLEADEISDLEN